jgi:hypothetical protein
MRFRYLEPDATDENDPDDPPPPYEPATRKGEGPTSGTDSSNQFPFEGCVPGSSNQSAPHPDTRSSQEIDSINYQIPSERRKGWIDGAMQGFKEHLTIYEESQRPFIPPPNVSEEEAMNLRHDHEQQAIIGPKEAENHFKGMFVISRKYARKTELFTTMKESVTNNPVHLATFEKWYKEMQSTYDGCA